MKRVAVRLGQLGLTLVVTWFILTRVGVDLAALREVNRAEWTPDPWIFAASCIVLLCGYLFSAGLWGRIVRDLGGPTIPLWTAMRLFMVANLGRYVPGKVWQIAGLALLAKRHGVSAGVATGAAVLGQGVALMGAALLGVATLFGPNEIWRRFGLVGLVGGLLAASGIIAIVAVPTLFQRVMNAWYRVTRTDAPETPLDGGPLALKWFTLYLLNWGIYATAFWLLYLSLGDWRTFLEIGPAFAAAYVVGYLAVFAPAGAGIREGFLVLLLQPSMSAEAALVVALAARVWTTTVEVVPAAFFAATLSDNIADARSSNTGTSVS
jgi:uncharacterized membrane protein YbhN (UPF0104 family)